MSYLLERAITTTCWELEERGVVNHKTFGNETLHVEFSCRPIESTNGVIMKEVGDLSTRTKRFEALHRSRLGP